MGGKKWKAQSKRQSTKLRVKIEKKVKDHARKLKKEKKKNPDKFKKSKKDPGIPNNCPFKDEILAEAKEIVAKRQEAKEKRRIQLKEVRKAEKGRKLEQLRGQTLEGLVAGAEQRGAMYEKGQNLQAAVSERGLSDRSAKAYYKEFRKVVEIADVVLQVLDARDPLGTRCREVEQAVVGAGGKRLVLVLNKADLIPRDNLQAWIKHLRNEFPTVAFKASTQTQSRLGQANISLAKSDAKLTTSKCVGANTLMSLLGNYCRNKDVKTAIRVGVVGLPNVGKSSLINSLKRSRACVVGATPGVTKSIQEVQLDSKIKLIDSPGMVLASGNMSDANVALRNAMKVEALADPITPVIGILGRVPRKHLMLQYEIGHYGDTAEFLALLARQMGKLRKGGVPDRELAARHVLNDWNTGRIKYFTHPPEKNEADLSSEIVRQFTTEFSLENLKTVEDDEMETLPAVRPSLSVGLEAGSIVDTAKPADDEEEEMEEEGEEENFDPAGGLLPDNVEVAKEAGGRKKAKKQGGEEKEKADPLFRIEGNMRMGKMRKLMEKKEKKERRRRERVADGLSEDMESAFSALTNQSDDYSFETDFQ